MARTELSRWGSAHMGARAPSPGLELILRVLGSSWGPWEGWYREGSGQACALVRPLCMRGCSVHTAAARRQ